ncbi:16S rRNA (cytidine(1402)-2'-O)-methyltransferase [Oceanomicrobium pacificus]|uniref:Ribosomal RNA small subunit methyltransferase I n=1 Tax=Oceanomicrobium pacificus TaxID=2692916 RepID=A0A6B0TKT6_9RHOB|nr:16S rRNA (cytidine(1402)-2'-O)-methyltransferase [Oceanomicrobium pacificus]MXU64476.1 16S rRNA (cytidine(1402)-2'-O)-methyltransferase [Oceanomicrobium pacificus]
MTISTPELTPGLYLVATPIGTASDITLRALDILRHADVIAAEDTRNTRRLLDLFGIPLGDRPLLPYHDHNGAAQRPKLLAHIAAGRTVAYVSDAGTPLIADPGYQLAQAVRDAGHPVTAAPGASALLAALSVAGMPTDRFMFAGFLPNKGAARRSTLAELGPVPATLVFFESPKRLAATLRDMAEVFGPAREVAICRELTKRFEEVRRGPLGDMAGELAEVPAPKGEIVLVLGPPVAREVTDEVIDEALRTALATARVKDAAAQVAAELGLPRKTVYSRALALSGK